MKVQKNSVIFHITSSLIFVVFGSKDENLIEDSEMSVLQDLKAQLNRFRELEKSHAELQKQVKLLRKYLKEMEHKIFLDQDVQFLRAPPKNIGENEISPVEPYPTPDTVPIGFVYTQLPFQAESSELWPKCKRESITSEYAGLFFRAEGEGSSSFGETQNDWTNRITQIRVDWYYCDYNNFRFPHQISVPDSGWSETGRAGWYVKDQSDDKYNCEGIKVESSGGETRPGNTAIRLWKRVE